MNTIIMSVNDIEEPPWLASYHLVCEKILAQRNKTNWEVSVMLCSDRIMHQLNMQYRQKDSPTDVLSFSQQEGEGIPLHEENGVCSAGDIVISLDTIQRNAEKYSISMKEELVRVFIHGLLHLEGYDHRSNNTDEPMLRLQEQILQEEYSKNDFIEEKQS
ncbi:MAG: rRNA maturation RNase YbeY [Spirochaetales bacterium]|nr:rRNA maturation RNase YbeY [Spirochaetales bacterium]